MEGLFFFIGKNSELTVNLAQEHWSDHDGLAFVRNTLVSDMAGIPSKCFFWVLGHASIRKVLVGQAIRPEFDPEDPHKNNLVEWCLLCNLRAEVQYTENPWGSLAC